MPLFPQELPSAFSLKGKLALSIYAVVFVPRGFTKATVLGRAGRYLGVLRLSSVQPCPAPCGSACELLKVPASVRKRLPSMVLGSQGFISFPDDANLCMAPRCGRSVLFQVPRNGVFFCGLAAGQLILIFELYLV